VTTSFEPFLTPLAGDEERLRMVLEPVIVGQGVELINLHWVRGAHRDVVRIFVDMPGAGVTPGKGIRMAEIEPLSRLLSDVLDVADGDQQRFFRHVWDLEVGSPGLDRPLTKRSHFALVVGQRVKLRLRGGHRAAIKGRMVTLQLTSATDQQLDGVQDDQQSLVVLLDDVEAANVVYQMAAPKHQPVHKSKRPKPAPKQQDKNVDNDRS
jgi:ribosome maturation factor RimP